MKLDNQLRRSLYAHRDAFTLVEVIVSVAIISILAAVLLSSIKGVTGSSKEATCISNLRQLSTALLAYAQDHEMQSPPAAAGGSWRAVTGGWTGAWYYPDGSATNSDLGLAAYVDGIKTLQKLVVCPKNSAGLPYVANYTVMPTGYQTPPPAPRLNSFSAPSSVVWMADSRATNWGLGVTPNEFSRIQANHGKRASVLWLDGHVSGVEPASLKPQNFQPTTN